MDCDGGFPNSMDQTVNLIYWSVYTKGEYKMTTQWELEWTTLRQLIFTLEIMEYCHQPKIR